MNRSKGSDDDRDDVSKIEYSNSSVQTPRTPTEWNKEQPESNRVESKPIFLESDSETGSDSNGSDIYSQEDRLKTKSGDEVFKKRPTLAPQKTVSVDTASNKSNEKSDSFHQFDSDSNIEFYSSGTLSLKLSESELSTDLDSDAYKGVTGSLHRETAFIYMIIPPDGGYSWFVLLLVFITHAVIDGIVNDNAILLAFIEHNKDLYEARMVVVTSSLLFFFYLGGVFASALIQTYGFMRVGMIGIFLASIMLVVVSFCKGLIMTTCAYGVAGVFLSMIWVPSQLIVGFYFQRYRPIANGIASSGSGVGMVLFSLYYDTALPIVGYHNVIRIDAWIVFLLFFVFLGYRDIKPERVGIIQKDLYDSSSSSENDGSVFEIYKYTDEKQKRKSSKFIVEIYDKRKEKRRRLLRCCRRTDSSSSRDDETHYIIRTGPIDRNDAFYTGPAKYEETNKKTDVDGKKVSLVGSDEQKQRAAYAMQQMQDKQEYRLRRKKLPWYQSKCMIILGRFLDFKLLKLFEFRILASSALLFTMGLYITILFAKARAHSAIAHHHKQGIEKEARNIGHHKMITPLMGLSNSSMRIICGFLAYFFSDWTLVICGGGITFGGFMVFFSAFYGEGLLWFQVLFAICFGIAPAVYATLRTILYVKYVGLSNLTSAFGLILLATAISAVVGPLIGAALVHINEEYIICFAFAGICLMSSGILILVLPRLVRYRHRSNVSHV